VTLTCIVQVAAGLTQPVLRVVVVLNATLFSGLVWGTLALVVVVFAYLLYGVIRAGGIGLSSGGH
jgi:hypothetical protein